MPELPDYIARFIPALATIALIAPLALVFGAGVAWMTGRLRVQRGVRTPYTRKIFHFSIFTTASVLQLVWGLPGVVVFGSVISLIVLYTVWRGDGFPPYEALARPTDAPHRTMFIIIPLITTAVGGVLSNLLFPSYAYVGYLVAGWGDAVGEPVGTRWGRHRYRVPSLSGVPATRSLEGSAAVFTVGTTAALLGVLASGVSAGSALLVALAAGLAGALVEAFSNHGLDNLTVQVAAAGAAWLVAVRLLTQIT